MNNSLASRLMRSLPKGSLVSVLSESDYLDKGVVCSTDIPAINLLLSGKLDGGVIPGITQLVGDSRTFKCTKGDTPLRIFVTQEIYDKYFSS